MDVQWHYLFFSEKIVSVFESQSPKSFRKYPIRFTKEANIQSNYFYIDIISKIPDIRSKDIFKEPNLVKYCKKNNVAKSDLLLINKKHYYLYADFSKWDGSHVFTINNTLMLIVTEAIKKQLNNKKVYKNLLFKEINFLD